MVDSLNKKNEDEKPLSQLEGSTGGAGFYHGFDRPDPMKVNLAKEHEDYTGGPMNMMSGTINVEPEIDHDPELPQEEEPEKTPVHQEIENELPSGTIEEVSKQPKAPVVAPMPLKTPREPININWRLAMIIFGVGIVGGIVSGLGSYFGFGYYFDSKLDGKRTELSGLESQEKNLNVTPRALELPVQEVPVSTSPEPVENPTPTPAPTTPAETEPPIQQEQPPTPGTGGTG